MLVQGPMRRQVLVLLLLSPAISCLEEDDDQPFLQRFEEFRRDSIASVNETYGLGRMAMVANHSSAVLEFFGFLGHLFVNGTIGYVQEYCHWNGLCLNYTFLSANGSGELKQGVLSLYSEMNDIDRDMRLAFNSAFFQHGNLTDREDGFASTARWTFEEMFRKYYFSWSFAIGGLGFPLIQRCEQLHIGDFNFRKDVRNNPILETMSLVGPDCEKATNDLRPDPHAYDPMLEHLKQYCYKIANESGCFHNFLIRYTDYKPGAYEIFVDAVSKHLFQAVSDADVALNEYVLTRAQFPLKISDYGLCIPILLTDPTEKRQKSEWIAESVSVIAQRLRDAAEIFNETRPTTTTLSTITTLTPTLTTTFTPTPIAASTTNTTTTTSASVTNDTVLTQNTGHTSTVSSMSTAPISELEIVVNSVLDVHGVKGQKPWRDRVSEHQTIANETFRNLTSKYASGDDPQISFQVLVYLPYPKDSSDHCISSNKTEYFVEGNQKHGVDYFIHYYQNSSLLNTCLKRLWKQTQERGTEILDAIFSPDTKDLCEDASNKVAASTDTDCKFSGVVAVRCGYEFVWYELAYRYFTAGRAAGASFELSTGDTAYERNCGQIFLFP